jgi:hypothetical protein
VVSVAGTSCLVPAGHAPSGKHSLWFGTVDSVPLAHGVQDLSLVVLPCSLTYVPGAHTLQSAHVSAFMLVLNEPLAHAEHVRSESAVGSDATRSPARQCVASTHGVAARLS